MYFCDCHSGSQPNCCVLCITLLDLRQVSGRRMSCRYWTLTDNFEWAFGFAPRVNTHLQRRFAAS